MPSKVTLIRIFVSSPGDVADERKALEDVVTRINRTEGDVRQCRLELWKWEKDVVPQIGPSPQKVVDEQTPQYDIYLGIMKSRFGTPTGEYGSGTEQEFRQAYEQWGDEGVPWILFYFNDDPRPPMKREQVQQMLRVVEFREELEGKGITGAYTNGAIGFSPEVEEHLRKVLQCFRPVKLAEAPEDRRQQDPSRYLQLLAEDTSQIDIRGLAGGAKAHRFPIEELYIPLTKAAGEDPVSKGRRREPVLGEGSGRVDLSTALRNPRLVIMGDPGAGKTTFLRRIANRLCRARLGLQPKAARELGFEEAPIPVLVRLSDLHQHQRRCRNRDDAPPMPDSPGWLAHFLAATWMDRETGLDEAFWRGTFKSGPAVALLDGLDEVPSDRDRRATVLWLEQLASTYGKLRLVVTCRPAAYQAESVLSGFELTRIADLEDDAVKTFLGRWCEAVYADGERKAQEHLHELLDALRHRPEIRRLARNPVMLTALAVVHWNEKRLPEQRADLYESILTWLARSREKLPNRPSDEECLSILQALALAMQVHEEGRQVQVPHYRAAEAIEQEWRELPQKERRPAAQKFLSQEETDSGIVVKRGTEIRFWHLTFQEYLAARALAGLGDQEQHQAVVHNLYRAEWKEVVLLLAGVLLSQGARKRVDNLISAVLDHLGQAPSLPEQARCAGILGAVVRDLTPFRYEPAAPRYRKVLDAALAVFTQDRSKQIPIKVAIEAAEALGQAGDPRFEEDHLEKNWAEIPAGEFLMGAQDTDSDKPNFDPELESDFLEGPVHRVWLDAYRIGRYPVTVDEYRRFIEAGGYQEEDHWRDGGFGQWAEPEDWEEQARHPNRPVVDVNWFEAAAYARWRGAELPTEAQWERAARGVEGRKYPWGDELKPGPKLLNYEESNTGGPTPVGVHPRGSTPERIADLAGNVWEWCRDWYGPYAEGYAKNPNGPEEGGRRVLRGGAWDLNAGYCRASLRVRDRPSDRGNLIGFRLVLVGCSARTEKRKP